MMDTLTQSLTSTLALGMPGTFEWVIIGLIGLLLFGSRLPEVGKSIAGMIVGFKKGMREVEDEISKPKPADKE